MSISDDFWNELGGGDNTAVTFAGVEQEITNPTELEDQEIDLDLDNETTTTETTTQPATQTIDPVLEKLTAMEARYQALEQKLEQGLQQRSLPPAQQERQPQPQAPVQYVPSRYLSDADLAQYHAEQSAREAQLHQHHAQQLHTIRVGMEQQALANAKAELLAKAPDLFKYVDEEKLNKKFHEDVSQGNFGLDWKPRIEAVYKISKFSDLERQANELAAAREAKATKQKQALRAVPSGGATYQPTASQPAAGSGRGFKSASAGFLAELGLG